MGAPERDPLEWLRRAQSDLLTIDNNLNSSQIPWDAIVPRAASLRETAEGRHREKRWLAFADARSWAPAKHVLGHHRKGSRSPY